MEEQNQNPAQPLPPDEDPNLIGISDFWYQARICIGFLTRVPVFSVEYSGQRSLAVACWAFPLVGVLLGISGGLVLWIADGLGLPSALSALCALTFVIVVTGALHEDGLADTADGLGVSGDAEWRLAAMRDSRIGAFGVLALIVVFGARWAALDALAAVTLFDAVAAMIAAAAVSRGVLPYIMHSVPNARTDGLSIAAGRPEQKPALIAAGISAAIALVMFGPWDAIVVLLFAVLSALALVQWARRAIGGQTGDVLGAVQQIVEAAVLMTAVGLAV